MLLPLLGLLVGVLAGGGALFGGGGAARSLQVIGALWALVGVAAAVAH